MAGRERERERYRQLSHISFLIRTDKVLLEGSLSAALFALASHTQIYNGCRTLARSEVCTSCREKKRQKERESIVYKGLRSE